MRSLHYSTLHCWTNWWNNSPGNSGFCCHQRTRTASVQSFTLCQQATMEIVRCDYSVVCSRNENNMGATLSSHPVCGASRMRRRANRLVAGAQLERDVRD